MTDIVRRRIEALVDPGSFVPHAPAAWPFRTIPPHDPAPSPGNGVTAGFGKVEGRPVGVYAQDPEAFGGSVGLGEAAKICGLMDAAAARGCPIVGLIHSAGARIQEGVDSLAGYGEIFERNVRFSGEVPQVSVILGPCAGGAVYSPALTDFIVLARGQGEMFVTGPDVIRKSTGEETDRESLGGSAVHMGRSGVGHLEAGSMEEACGLARRLLSYLPSHRAEPPPRRESADDPGRLIPAFDAWAQGGARDRAFDVRPLLEAVADAGSFFELQPAFARNIVTALARLGGEPVGLVANNSAHLSGALDIAASEKAARFVRSCDSFGLPVVTFVDVPGYWPGVAQEHQGLIRRGAKLLFAYAEASVPKLTVVVHKAYGGAYDVMGSKHLGAAYNCAWPTAEIAVMGPAGAVEVLYKKDIAQAPDPAAFRERQIQAYRRDFVHPRLARERGYIDEVIQPSETRRRLCAKLKECLARGMVRRPRAGNIPL